MGRIEDEAERYGVLQDEQRRRIYLLVRAASAPMTREEVAEAAGISRNLAAFHLERLLEADLLRAHYARDPGVGGPGAGRPAKRYQPSDAEVALTIPPRNYDLAGRLLAQAVEGTPRAAGRVQELASDQGRALGEAFRKEHRYRRISKATQLAAAAELATELGYEPRVEDDQVVLRNCPFHALVDTAPGLVCGLNQALLAGAMEGLGAPAITPDLHPAEGRCCVLLREL